MLSSGRVIHNKKREKRYPRYKRTRDEYDDSFHGSQRHYPYICVSWCQVSSPGNKAWLMERDLTSTYQQEALASLWSPRPSPSFPWSLLWISSSNQSSSYHFSLMYRWWQSWRLPPWPVWRPGVLSRDLNKGFWTCRLTVPTGIRGTSKSSCE